MRKAYRYNARKAQRRGKDGRLLRADGTSRSKKWRSGRAGVGAESQLPKSKLAERLVDVEDINNLCRRRLGRPLELEELRSRDCTAVDALTDSLCEVLAAIVNDLSTDKPQQKVHSCSCLSVLLEMWTGERRSAATLGREPFSQAIKDGVWVKRAKPGSREYRVWRKQRQPERLLHHWLAQLRDEHATLLRDLRRQASAFASHLEPLR